ncbi:MAG: RNA methyltransferase [Thiotrichaceae bacterium]|nr:RNA methyltransferase [Thiotrichaceae bacterium]
MSLNNIRIVMIATSHPGNIGSAARAMLTMGLTDLYLVNPKSFPDNQAQTMASGADSVLAHATVVNCLADAIADCHLVIGTSARSQRTTQWSHLDSSECGEQVAKHCQTGKVAIIFGRESSGMTNEELEYCQYLTSIPVNPEFKSLNIAAAVQVLAYECSIAVKRGNASLETKNQSQPPLADAKAMEGFYQHLEKALITIRYLDPNDPRLLMRKFRGLFGRTQLQKKEVSMLRGFFSAAQGSKFIGREAKVATQLKKNSTDNKKR